MQAPQKADQEGQSEPINHPGVEYKDVQFLAKIILLGTEEHISRLCGVVLLFHLRVGEHVRDLSILVQLLRGELIVVRIKLFPIEWRAANDPIDLVHFLIHLTGIFAGKSREDRQGVF